jgi:hypothetical protein
MAKGKHDRALIIIVVTFTMSVKEKEKDRIMPEIIPRATATTVV